MSARSALAVAALLALRAPASAVNITVLAAPAKAGKASPAFWPQGLNVSLATLGYYKGFSGDRRRASGVINEGLTQDDLSIRFQRKTMRGVEFRQEFSGRYTNDRSLSPNKDFILQNLFASVEKADRFAARFGNILTNFSRYTMGTSLHGINGYYQSGRLRASGVVARGEEEDGVKFRRWTAGGRLEALNAPVKKLGLNAVSAGLSLVTVNDEEGSISNKTNLQKLDASVFGMDARLQFKRDVTLALDMAGSNQRDNKGPGNQGSAASADLDWKPGRFSAGLGFERQDPRFRSPAGSASPDVRRWTPRAAYQLAPWAQMDLAGEFSQNNLFRQLAYTTFGETYRTGLSVRPLGWRKTGAWRNLGLSLGLRVNRQYASDASSKRRTANYDLAANHPLGRFNYGLGLSLQSDKDLVSPANDRFLQTPKFSLGYQWSVVPRWNFSLNPTLSWSHTRDAKVATGQVSRTLATELGLGGTVDGARFNLGFGTTSSQRPGTGASYQRRLRASFGQTLRPGLSLTADFAHTYATESDRTRDYDENQWSLGLKYDF